MGRGGLYYEPSNQLASAADLGMLAFTAGPSSLLAVIYGFLIFHCPFIYANLFAAIGMGFAIGYIARAGVQRFKIRSPKIAGALAAQAGVIALYVSWIAWSKALILDAGGSGWLLTPGELFDLMTDLAEHGAWTIFGDTTPKGWALWLVWLVEAGVFIVTPMHLAWQHAKHPFCEPCGEWTEIDFLSTAGPGEPGELVRAAEDGDFQSLLDLGPWTETPHFTRMSVSLCPACKKTAFLTVEDAHVVVDNNETKVKADTVVANLILSPETLEKAQALRTLGEVGAEDPDTPKPRSSVNPTQPTRN